MAKRVYRGARQRGRLLGVIRTGGQWLAVTQALSTERESDPILTQLVPVASLTGSPKRKADRWLRSLA